MVVSLCKSQEKLYNWSMAHPPKNIQAILWSADVNQLDLIKDKYYIIHQVLIYGTMTEIRWLLHAYGMQEVVKVFVGEPARWYSKKVFHFVKNYILPLRNKKLYEEDYVTSIYGPIRQRTQGRV